VLSGRPLVDELNYNANKLVVGYATWSANQWICIGEPNNKATAHSLGKHGSAMCAAAVIRKRTAVLHPFICQINVAFGRTHLTAKCRDENNHQQSKHRPS
jgi:hypothetical protein